MNAHFLLAFLLFLRVECNSDFCSEILNEDPELMTSWMSELPENLVNISLSELALPGSHDSATYSIDDYSKLSYERTTSWFVWWAWVFYILKKWTKTMDSSITEQLEAGIRYFDLRVMYHESEDQFFFVHMQFANEVEAELRHFRDFLTAYPRECIILDFQHVYKFQDNVNISAKFEKILLGNLGDLAFNWAETKFSYLPSLREMWTSGKQVLLLKDGDDKFFTNSYFIRDRFYSVDSKWPNTNDVNELKAFLDYNYQRRQDKEKLWVFQAVLTPQKWDYFCGTSVRSMTKNAHVMLKDWLQDRKKDDERNLNVVIADFCVKDYPEFARDVVSCNC